MTNTTEQVSPENKGKLDRLYKDSLICSVIVNYVASDMTRAGIKIDPNIDALAHCQLEDEASRLNIWDGIYNTILQGRLYGGAVGILVIKGENMEEELNVSKIKKGTFVGIATVDRWVITQTSDANFIMIEKSVNNSEIAGKKIHKSRCFFRFGIESEKELTRDGKTWGRSVLDGVFERISRYLDTDNENRDEKENHDDIRDAIIYFRQKVAKGIPEDMFPILFGSFFKKLNPLEISLETDYFKRNLQAQNRELYSVVDKTYKVMAKSLGFSITKNFGFEFYPANMM